MKSNVVIGLSALSLLAPQTLPAAPSEWLASSGVLPTDACPPWTQHGSGTAEIIDGVMLVRTQGCPSGQYWTQSEIAFPSTTVIEFSVRFRASESCEACGSARSAVAVQMNNAARVGIGCFVGPDEVFLLTAGCVRGATANVDTDGAVHDYRLEIASDGSVVLSYDGDPLLSGHTFFEPNFAAADVIIWGEASSLAFGESEWSSFSHNAHGESGGCLADLSGNVHAGCEPGLVLGTQVDLFDGDGNLVAEALTDEAGNYGLFDVSPGVYDVLVIAPLGYEQVPPATITLSEDQVLDFELVCLDPVMDPGSMGFWKHNVAKHMKGQPQGTQVSEEDLLGFAEEIYNHFFLFPTNSIDIEGVTFVSTGSGPMPLDLAAMNAALDLRQASLLKRAQQQYLALLLNAASLRVGLWTVVSEDGHTCSEAVTFIAGALKDGDPENDEAAKDVADAINNGLLAPAGLMPPPEEIPDFAYREPGSIEAPAILALGRPTPNPSNGPVSLQLDLPEMQPVDLGVFDTNGRRIRAVLSGVLPAGRLSLAWDGRDDSGRPVAAGVYQLRLETQRERLVQKTVRLR